LDNKLLALRMDLVMPLLMLLAPFLSRSKRQAVHLSTCIHPWLL